MTEDELTGQIAWFRELADAIDRKEYRLVRDLIYAAIKLLERQKEDA